MEILQWRRKTSYRNKSGIEKSEDLIKSVKLFPNPNTGKFQVEIELSQIADIQADLFSIKGLKTCPSKFDKGKDQYLLDFNLMRLEPGVYFVNVQAGKEIRRVKFIVE